MRICLVGPTYPYRGGISHHTTLLAEHLRAKGRHDVLLISFSRQYPGWLYKGRDDRDPSAQALQSEAEYLLNPLGPLSWVRTLRRIRQFKADLVVIPWWVPFWAPAWFVLGRGVKRLLGNARLIFICHNVLPHESGGIGSWLWPRVTRITLRAADAFIVHAASDAQQLQRLIPNARVALTPLPTFAAVAPPTAAPSPFSLPGDRPLLLFAGFVRPYKGLDVLLEALPHVLASRPVHLLVAGEFWEGTEKYSALLTKLGIEDAVTLHDAYVPNEVLASFLQGADVVVLPYRSATQSAIVQLAFGYGRPVITTDVGGLAEVVDDGWTGLVVPPEDPEALAAAINRFFDEGMGPVFQQHIAQVEERFSWDRLVETLLDLARGSSTNRAQTGSP